MTKTMSHMILYTKSINITWPNLQIHAGFQNSYTFTRSKVWTFHNCLLKTQWRSYCGVKGGRVPPLTAKNLPKLGKKRGKSRKSGKKGKNREEKAKIRKDLSLCPSWQIGLATLLEIQVKFDYNDISSGLSKLKWSHQVYMGTRKQRLRGLEMTTSIDTEYIQTLTWHTAPSSISFYFTYLYHMRKYTNVLKITLFWKSILV